MVSGSQWTDVRTYGYSPLCATGHQPFRAAAQKSEFIQILWPRQWFQLLKMLLQLQHSQAERDMA